MGRYLVKIDELNEKNRYISDIINQIEENILSIDKLKNDIRWTSPSKDKFIVKYDEYVVLLNKMLNNLKSCLKVTEKFQSNFSDGYQQIQNDLKTVYRELEDENEQKY